VSESSPELVIITSFNEWMEGSMIEPSVSYGDFYLQLTAQLAAGYKAGDVLSAPPAPTVTAQHTLEPTASPTAGPSPTPTSTPTPIPSSTPLPDGTIVHVVRAGDTLLGIGERYGVGLEALLELNGLSRDAILWVGQLIVIGLVPVSPTGEAATPIPTLSMTLTGTVVPEAGSGAAAGGEMETDREAAVTREPTRKAPEATVAEPVVIVAPKVSSTPSAEAAPSASVAPVQTRPRAEPRICASSALPLIIAVFWCKRQGLRN
jgi:LysM repeat protein